MSHPIQVSLAGDGKVLVLTPETVRQAFNKFFYSSPASISRRGSKLRRWQIKPLESYKWHKDKTFTILDVLMFRHKKKHLLKEESWLNEFNLQEVKVIEDFINYYLLEKKYSLLREEGVLQHALLPLETTNSRKKVFYLVRYGVVFILEYLQKDQALINPGQALVLQTVERDLQEVFYDSIVTNQLTKRLEVKLYNFWKKKEDRSIPLADFNPYKVFLIKDIIPCQGFEITNLL